MLPCQEATWAGHPLKTVQGCVLAFAADQQPSVSLARAAHANLYGVTARDWS